MSHVTLLVLSLTCQFRFQVKAQLDNARNHIQVTAKRRLNWAYEEALDTETLTAMEMACAAMTDSTHARDEGLYNRLALVTIINTLNGIGSTVAENNKILMSRSTMAKVSIKY
jgi:tRNA-dihydrouridine synthase